MRTMKKLVEKYLLYNPDITRVLDVGSMDAQNGEYGTYRSLFEPHGFYYYGLDIEPGPNVDIVVKDPYNWTEVGHETFDVVISGQCLEHVEFPWQTMDCIAESLKPGGWHFNIVPSIGPVHQFPIDTYRYNHDGMIALCKWSHLDVVEVFTMPHDPVWLSTVLVARKPENG